MEEHRRSGDPGEQTATLLRLAGQLRAAAADADRPDVIAEVDELMNLIAGGTDTDTDAEKAGSGKSETVQRILNGLGY